MHRRSFLFSSTALTASLFSWLTADPAAAGEIASGRRIGEAAVTHIERKVRMLCRTDDEDGGGTLIRETAAANEMVTEANRSYSLEHERRLYAAAADLERMRAWAMFDVHSSCDDRIFESAPLRAQRR
ncbi:hypothetical protein [Streptomyces sp. NPDC007083]|uniref:hypothetical protein n=1 Tax=Streptomyces sp. NPDC007083 TaxID=3156913 RepID=UPI0033FAC6B1